MAVNPRAVWKSNWPYDPSAQRIKVDGFNGRYDAFLLYPPKLTKENRQAEASGNVIHLRADAKRYIDCVLSGIPLKVAPYDEHAEQSNMAMFHSLFEHEVQHVVQHYEIRGVAVISAANPLPWEKEACARQILHPSFQNSTPEIKAVIRFFVLDNLIKYGMGFTETDIWISEVDGRGTYPGVNVPRQITLTRV